MESKKINSYGIVKNLNKGTLVPPSPIKGTFEKNLNKGTIKKNLNKGTIVKKVYSWNQK